MISPFIEALAEIADPAARIRAVDSAHAGTQAAVEDLRSVKAAAIRELRATTTWREIGEILGVSKQRAEQLSKTPTKKANR